DALTRTDYALLFMDCQMPEMDGFETTRRIRTSEARSGKHVPIIAMTAHAMSEDRYKCLSAGMDDYVSKPVTRRKLKEVLTRHLSKSQPGEAADNGGGDGERPPRNATASEQPIDLSSLSASLGDADAREVVKTFVASTGGLIEKVDAALRERNVDEIK